MLNVAALEGNSETKKFLSEAVCGDMQANVKCQTIENYERADYVIWNGIKLESHANSVFPKLSEVKQPL